MCVVWRKMYSRLSRMMLREVLLVVNCLIDVRRSEILLEERRRWEVVHHAPLHGLGPGVVHLQAARGVVDEGAGERQDPRGRRGGGEGEGRRRCDGGGRECSSMEGKQQQIVEAAGGGEAFLTRI